MADLVKARVELVYMNVRTQTIQSILSADELEIPRGEAVYVEVDRAPTVGNLRLHARISYVSGGAVVLLPTAKDDDVDLSQGMMVTGSMVPELVKMSAFGGFYVEAL